MPELTTIVTAGKNPEKLKYTLEGLVEQSSEDFSILVVNSNENAECAPLIKEYADEYVGFTVIETEPARITELRNLGVKNAQTELVWFINEGDYISPESVEKVLETYKETGADIILPRFYEAGENEPYYLDWADMLATVPHVDKFDRALLNTLDLDGRIFKKKFFDLYSLTFPSEQIFYNTVVLSKCLFDYGASVSGCAGAIYASRSGVYSDGFDEGAEPCGENLRYCISVFDKIAADVRAVIEEETGSFDGDEYTFQEILFVFFSVLTDNFYRYFWYLTNEDITLLSEKFDVVSKAMVPDRRKKLTEFFPEMRFPGMYMKREDAAAMPMISLFADFTDYAGLDEFFTSLYNQRLPFFELFIRESAREHIPSKWINCENLHILPDKNFFAEARQQCRAVSINIKECSHLDPRILAEMTLSKAPKGMLQYVFGTKLKKYSAKTYLKNHGMAMR